MHKLLTWPAAVFWGFAALAGFSLAEPAAQSSTADKPSIASERPASAEAQTTTRPRRGAFGATERGVYKARIEPHWFHNNTRFWYRNDLRDAAKEFIVVDAETGTRKPAFDHQKLADALSKAAGQDYKADKLPFSAIEFTADDKGVQFEIGDKSWKCNLDSYECSPAVKSAESKQASLPTGIRESNGTSELQIASESPQELEDEIPPEPQAEAQSQSRTNAEQTAPTRRQRGDETGRSGPSRTRESPDGKWTAFTKENNVYVRSQDGAQEYQLSQDGRDGQAYGRLEWSPDSKTLIGWRIEPGERKEVYLIQSSPSGGGRAVLKSRPYALPGDKFTTYELNLFDVAEHNQLKPSGDRFEHEWESPRLHWYRDNVHFAYQQEDRGHQRLRLIEVDSRSGAVRNLIDEKTDTFIWTAHTENVNINYINWLEKTDELVYVSERDGWRHLYLVDVKEGKIKNQITHGDFVVRGIDRIDEENRQVWFRASGRNPDQDPYFIHYYRVNFDGSGLVALTDGNGNHAIQYSPDRNYIIDTYSRVDLPPVHELRRVADCKRVCQFEAADISELKAAGWEPPEVFVAKGRDGKTDIWGIITRPHNLDPNKKYPVLEQIYAGPQGSYVPKSFSGSRRTNALTDLGFIVAQMDGMGTANRSKAFHDFCWHNLKDAGFPDRILWHKSVAAKYPYYDISRVGVYGTSAGGQSAAGALLFHPEFYKAAAANSGCHDNRMDKASWNEQWMGYPVGPQYSESSNIDNAAKLRGHLMLVVGEMDENVPPESTYRFVDALIRADKDFDLLVVPNGGHGAGGAYGQRRLQDFFVRHLQNIEPPNRNANASTGG
jgi:dipeptidyl aminopeptidase/acylaminoacyl peptidase